MPELRVGDRAFEVAVGGNLLDALLAAGVGVRYSCRAGSCHACLVRCLAGVPEDARPDALDASRRDEGWRLACQCRVAGDLCLEVFDPTRQAAPAAVRSADWLVPGVLRLRLQPTASLRYSPGQHVLLYSPAGVARPYSFAGLAQASGLLEFHIDCSRPGAFCDEAARLSPGTLLRLGAVGGGALHYDAEWGDKSLWLVGCGTGLAPLLGIIEEARRTGHGAPIRLTHVADEATGHYLADELRALLSEQEPLQVDLPTVSQLDDYLLPLRRLPRQTQVLVCGRAAFVERLVRHCYLAGIPRSHVHCEIFFSRANEV